MQLLHWKNEYSVGIDAVDSENQELIALINRIYEQLDSADAKLSVPAFFRDLLKAIGTHFALEERFMRDHDYGQLDRHKADHARLLDELRDIIVSFDHSAEIDCVELSDRLAAWFFRHFRTHDAELHQTLGVHPH